MKLNGLNEVDMFCLRYVFQPRINLALNALGESQSDHCLSTMGNMIPNQLFLQGAIKRNRFPRYPDLSNPPASRLSLPQSIHRVGIPRSAFYSCNTLLNAFGRTDDILQCHDFGFCLYWHVSQIVG